MDSSLFRARIGDTASLCRKTDSPRYLGFLSEEEAAFAAGVLRRKDCRFSFWGGYDGARRVILACFPDWCEQPAFPIVAVTLQYRKTDILFHRDVLGALMALGIERETVGDILIGSGRAVVFVMSEIEPYILSQVKKVGGVGVTVRSGCNFPLPEGDRLVELTVTASSLRLDCVVAALCGLSRTAAKEMVEQGLVFLHSVPCEKIIKTVESGDILTVRGKGKFILGDVSGKTKKGRTVICYRKYM